MKITAHWMNLDIFENGYIENYFQLKVVLLYLFSKMYCPCPNVLNKLHLYLNQMFSKHPKSFCFYRKRWFQLLLKKQCTPSSVIYYISIIKVQLPQLLILILFPHFIIIIHYYYHFIYKVSSNSEVVTEMTNKNNVPLVPLSVSDTGKLNAVWIPVFTSSKLWCKWFSCSAHLILSRHEV